MGVFGEDDEIDPEYSYYVAEWRIACQRADVGHIKVGDLWDSLAYGD